MIGEHGLEAFVWREHRAPPSICSSLSSFGFDSTMSTGVRACRRRRGRGLFALLRFGRVQNVPPLMKPTFARAIGPMKGTPVNRERCRGRSSGMSGSFRGRGEHRA